MGAWTTQEHPCVFLDAQVSPRAQERPRAPRSTRGPPRSTQGGQQTPPIPPRSLPVPRCGARNPPKESPHAKAWRLESPNQTPRKQSRQRETPESFGRAPCRTSRRGGYPKTVPKQSQNNQNSLQSRPPKIERVSGSLLGRRPDLQNQTPRTRESPRCTAQSTKSVPSPEGVSKGPRCRQSSALGIPMPSRARPLLSPTGVLLPPPAQGYFCFIPPTPARCFPRGTLDPSRGVPFTPLQPCRREASGDCTASNSNGVVQV